MWGCDFRRVGGREGGKSVNKPKASSNPDLLRSGREGGREGGKGVYIEGKRGLCCDILLFSD